MYFSYVALSSSFKETDMQAKFEEIFFGTFTLRSLFYLSSSLESDTFENFYVGSTCIDIIKVVNHCFSLWFQLERCPLRPRRLLTAELEGDSLEHLPCFFIFLLLSFWCHKNSFLVYHVRRST